MRSCTVWLLMLAVACDDGDPNPDATGDDDGGGDTDTTGDTDTDTVPDTDTDADTDDTEDTDDTDLGCFADWTYDVGDDASIEGTGIDMYDDSDHSLLVYEQRDYPDTTALGLSDYAITYTYDASGLLIFAEQDLGNDGTTDYAVELVYDGAGLLVEMLEDLDGNGATDVWWTFSYDAEGRLILSEGDVGNDGTIDSVEMRFYTDPTLAIGSATIDSDNDGYTDSTIEFEYDAAGNLLFERIDTDANGEAEFVYVADYDPTTGVLTGEELKFSVYDPYAFRLVDLYTYDTLGRRVDHLSQLHLLQPIAYDAPPERGTWTFGGDCP